MSGLTEVARLLREETGIALLPNRETALRSALRRAAPELTAEELPRAAADPAGGRALLQRLIDEITTQETTFARDSREFEAIDWRSLLGQAQAAGGPVIRVWSAGCATGEEAYTLAILANEEFAPVAAPVDILGTDISAAALAAAEAGRYRQRAVDPLPPGLRQRYLRRDPDGRYQVVGSARRQVRFQRHNLVRDPFPPLGEAPFDLIVCRNTLIYFEPRLACRLITAFERSTRPGGMLILGAVDSLYRTGEVPRADGFARSGPAGRPATRPSPDREKRLTAALTAADKDDPGQALGQVSALLADDPLDPDANFVRGLIKLSVGDPSGAVEPLRRALYSDAAFALAAFTLGRAYDSLGDSAAARRAYGQALRILDPADERHEFLLQQVDIGDIAAACRVRLGGKA